VDGRVEGKCSGKKEGGKKKILNRCYTASTLSPGLPARGTEVGDRATNPAENCADGLGNGEGDRGRKGDVADALVGKLGLGVRAREAVLERGHHAVHHAEPEERLREEIPDEVGRAADVVRHRLDVVAVEHERADAAGVNLEEIALHAGLGLRALLPVLGELADAAADQGEVAGDELGAGGNATSAGADEADECNAVVKRGKKKGVQWVSRYYYDDDWNCD
jgi:hypothetical protein